MTTDVDRVVPLRPISGGAKGLTPQVAMARSLLEQAEAGTVTAVAVVAIVDGQHEHLFWTADELGELHLAVCRLEDRLRGHGFQEPDVGEWGPENVPEGFDCEE